MENPKCEKQGHPFFDIVNRINVIAMGVIRLW